MLPPGKLCEKSTAGSSSLLGLCDIDTNAKDIRGELSDGLVGRGASSDDQSLQRGRVGGEDGSDAGLDGQELGLEDGSRMGLGGYSVHAGGVTVFGGEEELAKDVGGDDFWKRKVETEMAVVARGGAFDELVVSLPVTVGVSVTNVFSGEGTVFVAEHGNLGIDGGRVGEKVGGGESGWGGICGGDGEQESGGGAEREKGIARCREGGDGRTVVASERGDDAVWERVRTRTWTRESATWAESPAEDPPAGYVSEDGATGHGLGTHLCAELRAAARVEQRVVPLAREDVHEVHAAGIGDLDGGDASEEEG
jgi:hypothetical protein